MIGAWKHAEHPSPYHIEGAGSWRQTTRTGSVTARLRDIGGGELPWTEGPKAGVGARQCLGAHLAWRVGSDGCWTKGRGQVSGWRLDVQKRGAAEED